MGQTLSHGVYLPNEGERNCYAGLASNWQILNTAVGAIAEKAPLVHTHSKSDITDFPVYGTTAGTICEGNDSRLSDARTPVAHTHGKADITDLFDSANVWSGSNSFNSGLTINNAASLNAALQNAVKGDVSTTGDFAIFIKDKVNGNAATSLLAVCRGGQDSGGSYVQFNIDTKGNDNNRYNNGILLRINPADNSNNAILIPQRDKTIDLGTSSNQWKSLNGINPGGLSLPDYDSADPINFSQWDVTGAVGLNYYTPTVNGWLNISIWDRATNSIFVYRSGKERVGVFGNGSMGADGRIALLMPVKANATYTIIIKANANSDIYSANFFPCLGNV